MDAEEHANDVPSSVGISGSEGENNTVKNMEISDEENKLEAEKSVQAEEECDNNLLKEKKDLELQVDLELAETVVKSDEGVTETVHAAETVSLSLKDESLNGNVEIGRRGVKRARITVDDEHERQPSVHFVYKSLTRASKKKLKELLQQWSHWHAKHVSSSNDPSEMLESGEDTFFPAVCVGLESTSSVSFWMENQTMNGINTDVSPIDDSSVPLYDRGYALGLTSADVSNNVDSGLEIIEAPSRCFNCGSYSHALRECPRPRDYNAVNDARSKLKSRRNQTSRNPTRYYQSSPAGKYEGLRPGTLDDTTRQLLGLGELDPPPWLNRMRELGYPPGYLDVDDEDQPSGITIFTDKDTAEQEDGEIVGADTSKPKQKMSVEFPGINAPIPEKADERLWAARAAVPSFSLDIPRNWSPQRSSSFGSRGHHREQRIGDLRDDGPPGDPGLSSSQFSFQPRFGSGHVSPNSMAEGSSRRNPLHEEESPKPFSFHSQYYSTSERHFSPSERDSGSRHGSRSSGSMYDRDRDRDLSSRFNDRRPEDRHYHSRR